MFVSILPDEYFDSSLYPNNDSEEPLISNQYNSITNSKEPIKSKESKFISNILVLRLVSTYLF